jgi:hypothetical protein
MPNRKTAVMSYSCPLALLVLGFASLSCTPPHQNNKEFHQPFDLTEFLLEHQSGRDDRDITFQVHAAAGTPEAYGLLRFDWVDNGGRMSFQTDEKGEITMRFERDFLEYQVQVWAETKPHNQILLREPDYDLSTRRLEGGFIKVSW